MPDTLHNIAEAERLLSVGQLADAAQLAQHVLLANPQAALALNVLGQILLRQGDSQAAIVLWEAACRAGPTVPQPWVSLGEALFQLGQIDRALECFQEALARGPELARVRLNYGIVLQQAGRHEEAIDQLRLGMKTLPEDAEAAVALATSLHHLGRTKQAIDVLTAAAARHPQNPKLWDNLGVLHEASDRLQEAIGFYDRALQIAPHDAHALFNRGSSCIQLLRMAETRRDWEAAARIRPQDAQTLNNLAILELLEGHYERGFELFEARWAVRHKKFPIPLPEWDGSPLHGKRIVLYVEQGLGDMLQFCRFVPVLRRLYGCRIILAALPTLHGLLRSLEGVDAIVDIRPPYPPAEVQCSLVSVPRLLKTTLETIPAQVPYLRPDPAKVSVWRDRLAPLGAGLKVGLFWQGTQVDPNRIIHLEDLAPMWQARPEARFISLQKGPGEEEIPHFKGALLAVGHELLDFSDTAAVLANLDLLITIDTAVAHAAGALGRPTWVMLPHRPDWRWLLNRGDSPWYPTLRLYRQAQRKEWRDVLAAVGTDLAGFMPPGAGLGPQRVTTP